MKNIFTSILKSPTRLAIIIISVFIIGVNNNQSQWRAGTGVIQFDIISYYSYLPATFIEKDLKLSFINDTNVATYVQNCRYWPTKAPNGNRVIKTSMGMSLLYSPFFLIAHYTAPLFGFEADGFTVPYRFAIQFSGLFYLILGLHFLRKILLMYFSEGIAALSLLTTFFGTNLLCYATLQSAYSHQYNFLLFSAFIYFSIKWLETQKIKHAIILGFIAGLLVLVRPVNVIMVLTLVLFGIHSIKDLSLRIQLLFKNLFQILLMIFLAFLVFLPQMLYWKYVTGNYFFNSYVGEGFFFTKPHVIDCLLGFRKGWLIYTPLITCMLCGIYFLIKRRNPFSLLSVVLVPLYFYIVCSWWCWWYGGSFGQRAMIDIYPLLTLALGALLNKISIKTKTVKFSFGTIICLLILINCFQTIQFHYNVIHYDSMTFAAYKDRIFALDRHKCDRSLLQRPDYQTALKGIDRTVPFEGE